MILGFEAWMFWLVLMILFLIIEALTFNMTTVWFAAGSLAALILALFQASVAVQVIVMLAVSAALLLAFILFLKPRLDRRGSRIVPTNADRFIGADALVTEAIDPVGGSGLVKAMGQVWSAASADNQPISAGTPTVIVEIRGVKAVVRPHTADQN